MSSLFLASNWPFLAVVLLFALLLFTDGWLSWFGTSDQEPEERWPLEDHFRDLQYLHQRVREEDFRRAMFEQHQAMLDHTEETADGDKLGISVEHLMTSRVLSVLPETSRDEVAGAMESIRARHLIVCDGRDRLLGVISDRDLAGREGETAEDLMTPAAYSVRPDTSTAHALALMLRHDISCLPVVDGREQLVGVLTTSDLLLALSCYLELSAMLGAPVASASSKAYSSTQRRARVLRKKTTIGKAAARDVLAGMGRRAKASPQGETAGLESRAVSAF